MRFLKRVALVLFVSTIATAVRAQVMEKKALTLDGARKVIAAAKEEAKAKNAPGGVIAVVDDGGNLMALERLDGTFAAGAMISVGKARTAVLFKKPTKFFEDIIKNGRTAMVALPDSLFTPLQGSVPIMVDGQVVGGVGVSGAASAAQDEELAIAGANALMRAVSADANGAAARSVTYIESRKVADGFAKGTPLIEVEDYKIHASRRDAAGMAEVHANEMDIIYVMEGAATLVTGGTVVDGKTTAPGEIRGAAINGGETRKLIKGQYGKSKMETT
jgi:glc operon protein GlcG